MAKGFKTGGRQKGTPNRRTQDLLSICEEEGIDPFRAMLRLIPQIEGPREQFDAIEKVAQYLYPKRKAVELTGEDGDDVGITVKIIDYAGKK